MNPACTARSRSASIDAASSVGAEAREDVRRELAADERRPLQQLAFPETQPVEAAREQRLERGRNGLQGARLAGVGEQLLGVERVPLGDGDDPGGELRVGAPAEGADKLVASVRRRAASARSTGRASSAARAASGRARQRTKIGASSRSPRCSMRSSSVGSAQWMSSNTSTAGRSRRDRSEEAPQGGRARHPSRRSPR